jgi:hypothetical protein
MISDTHFESERTAPKARTSGFAMVAVVLFTILGGIAVLLANVLLWVNSTLISTDGFTAAVNDALDNPEVEQRMADVLAERVVNSDQVQQRIDSELPPNLQLAARAARPQVENLVSQVTLQVLESDLTGNLRDTAVRRLHARVLDVLEDRRGPVEAQNDQIVLDVREIVQRIFDRIGVTPPAAVQQENFGQVVLVRDVTGLKQASTFVRNSTEIAVGAIVIAALLFAAAIFMNRDRRQGVLFCGYAIAAVGLLTLVLLWAGNQVLASSAEERTVLLELVKSLEYNLRLQSLGLIVLGACLVIVADRRLLGFLQSGWNSGAAAVERFGVGRAALIGGAALTLVLLVV